MTRAIAALAAAATLTACGAGGGHVAGVPAPRPASRVIETGPAADYPMVLGSPYVIDGTTYTPSNALNVDEVGYATADGVVGGGLVSASHRTLPMPSYVEVTALDSGRTALVRVERRGPMTNDRLIGLSSGALAQLGIADGAPVRVRRVNPVESDRAKLRTGKEAPLRMDTPAGLLTVLKRRLPTQGSTSLSDPRQAQISGVVPTANAIAGIDPDIDTNNDSAVQPTPEPSQESVSPESVITPPPGALMSASLGEPAAPADTIAAPQGRFIVQLGAFSVRSNADRLAAKVEGHVVSSGRLALVRLGPYASRGQAADALAKLRAQGYTDARIETLR